MKKYFISVSLGIFAIVGGMAGCNKNNSPVIPAGSAVLKLTIPAKILNSVPSSKSLRMAKGLTVPDSSQGRLKYFMVNSGEAPVTGSIDFASGSQVGEVAINLPKAGKWIVSAEWFYTYNPNAGSANPSRAFPKVALVEVPEFVGADMVDVQGTTPFTLNLEDIGYSEYACYSNYLTDPNDCDYGLNGNFYDYYSFDSGVAFPATLALATPDIQAVFDAATTSTYFTSPVPGNSPVPIYAYLGTGDLVNFPVLPDNTVFYSTTLQAKAAVLGQASAALTPLDVFVVKVPSTNGLAWLQIDTQSFTCAAAPSSALLYFWFVYNNQGLNYMKFQETTDGHLYCNLNTPAS